MPKSNKIQAMDKNNLRDFDGVTMDLESYKKHCNSQSTTKSHKVHEKSTAKHFESKEEEQAQNTAITNKCVFACNPVHVGWYKEQKTQITYPIMAGAISPQSGEIQLTPSGSYVSSGSFMSSYLTSYLTSFLTSYTSSYMSSYFLSSYYLSSFSGSCSFAHGYGLELI